MTVLVFEGPEKKAQQQVWVPLGRSPQNNTQRWKFRDPAGQLAGGSNRAPGLQAAVVLTALTWVTAGGREAAKHLREPFIWHLGAGLGGVLDRGRSRSIPEWSRMEIQSRVHMYLHTDTHSCMSSDPHVCLSS